MKRYKIYFCLALILVLGLLLYAGTVHHTMHFDDEFFIEKNPCIRFLYQPHKIWEYASRRFIGYLSFAVNYQIHQLRVEGYHYVNIAIHILGAFCVYWLWLLLAASPRLKEKEFLRKHRHALGLFAGLIFVAHPVQTQAVTYIWQRVASLATLFYLLSLCLYFQGRLKASGKYQKAAFFAAAFLSAVLAMFTKQMAFTLPVILLIMEKMFFKSRLIPKKNRWLWGLCAVLILLIVPLHSGGDYLIRFSPDLTIKSESYPGDVITGWNFLLSQARVHWKYFQLLVAPYSQNLDYSMRVSHSLFEPKVLAGAMGLLALFLLAWKIRKKYPLMAFGIFWYFITISIEASIVPIDCLIYEHRLYLPMTGYCFFIVAFLAAFIGKKSFRAMTVVFLIYLTVLSVLCWRRNLVWKNDVTLWSDVIKKVPTKLRAWNNRGRAYGDAGFEEPALADFSRALELDPTNHVVRMNRGSTYRDLGMYDKAMADLNRVIEEKHDDHAYGQRGSLYALLGNDEKAIEDFSEAVKRNPNHLTAVMNRGVLYARKGKWDKALADFGYCIEREPFYIGAYLNRIGIFVRQKKYDAAFKDLDVLSGFAKEDYRVPYQRGLILYVQKKYKKAVKEFNKALALTPFKGVDIMNDRGLAYMRLEEFENAMKDFNYIIYDDPKNALAYFNRGMTRLRLKEYQKGLEDLEKAKGLGYQVDEKYLDAVKKQLSQAIPPKQ